jgi:hypothetical protein
MEDSIGDAGRLHEDIDDDDPSLWAQKVGPGPHRRFWLQERPKDMTGHDDVEAAKIPQG